MALKLNDRVKETSTTTGTGTLNLSGAVSNFETFVAGVGDGNTTYYAIVNRDEDEWEVGIGTVTDASTDTLSRSAISSSNSDSDVNFSAGTKDVFCTLPATRVGILDNSNNFVIGSGAAGVDYTLTFDGADSDGVITWMEDEDHLKFSDDTVMDSSKRLYFYDEGGEYIYGDGTDLYLTSGADINIPANIGVTFGNDGEKIEGDGTDLTISGNNINLTAVADVVIPADVGITFGSGEKIEGDSTDLTITSGAKINLSATSDVVIPANVGITFGSGEKIEGDSTNLTITSGADIALTATSDINVPSGVGMTFGDDGEKIEGDGTDLTIASSGVLNLAAGAANQIKVTDGAILPITDDDVDLGSATYEFQDAFFDGTVTTDGLTVSGTPTFADGSIALADLDIDGGTDIGAAIVDADLFIVDDGAGGANRKVAASRLKTYASGSSATQGFSIAMAVAL